MPSGMDPSTDLVLIQQLCKSLDVQGVKTLVLTVNISTFRCEPLGCTWGRKFLDSIPEVITKFRQFCEDKVNNSCQTEGSYYGSYDNGGNITYNDNKQPFPTNDQGHGKDFTQAADGNLSSGADGFNNSGNITYNNNTPSICPANDQGHGNNFTPASDGNFGSGADGCSSAVKKEEMGRDNNMTTATTEYDTVSDDNESDDNNSSDDTIDTNNENLKVEHDRIMSLRSESEKRNVRKFPDKDASRNKAKNKFNEKADEKDTINESEVKSELPDIDNNEAGNQWDRIACDACGKQFGHKRSLQRHIRDGRCRKPSEKLNIIRQKLLKRNQMWKEIRAENSKNKEIRCKLCSKVLSTKTNLTQHVRMVHNKERNHVCHVCGSAFQVKHKLDIHLRTHTGDLPFQCSFCGKGYRSKDSRGKHEASEHRNEKPYVCHICGKAYRQSGHLGLHQKLHNSEYKPVTCVHCPERFRTYFALRRHILNQHKMEDLVSNASKLYYCDMCPKVFSDKKYIESHRNSHLGLKPHKCDVCQKAFSDKSNLRQHQATHEEKDLECEICCMRFSQTRSLKSHKMTMHKSQQWKC